MPEFIDSNYPRLHVVVHHLENLSIKYYQQKFCIRFAFPSQHWTELSIEKFLKNQFLEGLRLNQLKTWLAISCYLLLAYSPKKDNKHPSEIIN